MRNQFLDLLFTTRQMLVGVPRFPMTKPSAKVQEAVSATLLDLLKSPDLTPEDLKWVRHLAERLIPDLAPLNVSRFPQEP